MKKNVVERTIRCERCFSRDKNWYEIIDTKSNNKIKLCYKCGESFYEWFQAGSSKPFKGAVK